METYQHHFIILNLRTRQCISYFTAAGHNVAVEICMHMIDPLHKWRLYLNDEHLMTGPEGNSEFCFPRRS